MFYKRISDLHPVGTPHNGDWNQVDPIEIPLAGSVLTSSTSTSSHEYTTSQTGGTAYVPSSKIPNLNEAFRVSPWLSSTDNYVNVSSVITGSAPETTSTITSEYYNKALWFEIAIQKGQNKVPTSDPTKTHQYESKRLNANLLFKNIQEISAISANINVVSSNNAHITNLTATYADITSLNVTSLTANYADISYITSTNITTNIISSNVGIINNLTGINICYENGDITNITATNISTTNITATGVAQLTAMAAYWADLAENQESDDYYPAGTLIKFGGDKEITIADDHANAVVSYKPAILLNNKETDSEKIMLPIVLNGRSFVKTIGKIKKFDRLYLSNIPGLASNIENGNAIGIALESSDDDNEKLVEAILQLIL